MKVHPTDQWRLLDVQGLDTRLSQIEHRRRTLPAHLQVEQLEGRRTAIHTALVTAQTDLADLQREITKAEEDVTLVRDRAARNERRLETGTGPAKELQALQHELASLERRQGDLEEIQLAIMERAEQLEQRVSALESDLKQAETELAATSRGRAASIAELDEEADRVTRERALIVPGLAAELVALYEKIRAQTGIGAAPLRQQRCEGCRLQLTGADLARIAAAEPDEVLRCEECRRILVRTAEYDG